MERADLVSRLQRVSPARFAFVLGLISPLAYVLITGHVWEDYLITFRHSRNLAEGNGLVYQPGERVHGFTSPLGVLLPAFFHFVLGRPESFLPALWCFRVVGVLAFGGGVACFVNAMARAGIGAWGLLAALLFVFEIKGAAYSVNGQETGFMILFLGWTVDLLSRPGPYRWKSLAVAWAGLQWTRPDGFIIGGAWAIARLLFTDNTDRRELFFAYLKALGLSLVLYAPWLIFTTAYYGTPVPHTVIAKSVGFEQVEPTLYGWMNHYTSRLRWILEPTCFFFGGWPKWTMRFAMTLGLVGSVLWMLPGGGPLFQFARRASFAFLLLVLYFCKITVYAWYVPPAAFLLLASLFATVVDRPIRTALLSTFAYVAAVMVEENRLRIGHSSRNLLLIIGGLLCYLSFRTPRWLLKSGLAAAAIGFLAAMFGMQTLQFRAQQTVIENGVRTKVGLWLRDHVSPGETVYLECLGYIGYFSNCHMLDYPGLATPKVAAAHRARQWPKELSPTQRMVQLIPELKPDWLVLRSAELLAAKQFNVLGDEYQVRERFDAESILTEQYADLPGLGYLFVDSNFTILERKKSQSPEGQP
jgi:hypothetical protein